ncbi:polysialyltransferase family glycosyltransferase [Pseudoalteromonas sp. T1lg23B]|uniref:polysialyltransferase family glycosyltransferase n=1 Tax=Pseudoalteromonas sp. T1lg23B TaxID=2077097 RepID=UPI000CF723BE|nr:polysialyltransferase family glycosyltransferase [Pseudoalteromonas sp. T1lg23B]
MNIGIYDVNLINHKNYIGSIISELRLQGHSIVAFYDQYNDEAFNFLDSLSVQCIHVKHVSYNYINGLLKNNEIDILVHNAQRLGDSAFVTVAKNLSIKSIMIQHGMYIPHLKRHKSLFINNIYKTFRYAQYSKVVAKAIGASFPFVFKSFLKHFVKSVDYTKAIPFFNDVNSSYVFVYGKYWETYHHENFGYDRDVIFDVGYHELRKVDKIKSRPKILNSVCYVAQTLVEDGRLERCEMERFLKKLSDFAKKGSLEVYVKLHPRSDLSLYEGLGFSLERESLPYSAYYLGHYSSLLGLCGALSPLYLYEFPEHPIPHYFKENSYCYDNEDELFEKLLESNDTHNVTGFDISNVFSVGLSSQEIAKKILGVL